MDETPTERARKLRRESTMAERALWQYLRPRKMDGARFRRQHTIGNCFPDFCCIEDRLIIEVDGDTHLNSKLTRCLRRSRRRCARSVRRTSKGILGLAPKCARRSGSPLTPRIAGRIRALGAPLRGLGLVSVQRMSRPARRRRHPTGETPVPLEFRGAPYRSHCARGLRIAAHCRAYSSFRPGLGAPTSATILPSGARLSCIA